MIRPGEIIGVVRSNAWCYDCPDDSRWKAEFPDDTKAVAALKAHKAQAHGIKEANE